MPHFLRFAKTLRKRLLILMTKIVFCIYWLDEIYPISLLSGLVISEVSLFKEYGPRISLM